MKMDYIPIYVYMIDGVKSSTQVQQNVLEITTKTFAIFVSLRS